jgi:hypothetical protein
MAKQEATTVRSGVMDFGRASFSKVPAPRKQPCACGCGQWIDKGQEIFSRTLMKRGKPAGQTRIIDLEDHYERWFEDVAHKYATKAADKIPGLRQYLEGSNP